MRIKVMQFLGVFVLLLGIMGTPALGRGGHSVWDCGTSSQNTCGGG